MSLKESYAAFGSDFDSVEHRLGGEKNVQRYCQMFLQDESYSNLHAFLDEGNIDEAFRMAHTLKGSSQMLGFSNLHVSVDALTEALRHRNLDDLDALVSAVDADYAQIVEALSE